MELNRNRRRDVAGDRIVSPTREHSSYDFTMQYQLKCVPETLEDLPKRLHALGCNQVSVREHPILRGGVEWMLYRCASEASRAIVGVCRRMSDDSFRVVSVSMDLRRMLYFWRWRGDYRLARTIARALIEIGAVPFDD